MKPENPAQKIVDENGQTVYESVDLSKVPPMNNPGCQHEYMREAEPSVIPGTHTEVCRKCPHGRIVQGE